MTPAQPPENEDSMFRYLNPFRRRVPARSRFEEGVPLGISEEYIFDEDVIEAIEEPDPDGQPTTANTSAATAEPPYFPLDEVAPLDVLLAEFPDDPEFCRNRAREGATLIEAFRHNNALWSARNMRADGESETEIRYQLARKGWAYHEVDDLG